MDETRNASSDETPPRIRKAWRVTVRGFDSSCVLFAATAGKARQAAWRSLDADGVRIIDVVARRMPSSDVELPARDPMVDMLSQDELHCLLHAFGADGGDPVKAGYRDYFYTRRDDPPLVALAGRGLMRPMDGDAWGEGMTYFVMTEQGKRVALSAVPEYGR